MSAGIAPPLSTDPEDDTKAEAVPSSGGLDSAILVAQVAAEFPRVYLICTGFALNWEAAAPSVMPGSSIGPSSGTWPGIGTPWPS